MTAIAALLPSVFHPGRAPSGWTRSYS